MAALIPAIGTCLSNMTGGERRLAYRLEQKLEDDWLLWFDVPLGPRNVHPDFVVFNPRRGILVLEVKEWTSRPSGESVTNRRSTSHTHAITTHIDNLSI